MLIYISIFHLHSHSPRAMCILPPLDQYYHSYQSWKAWKPASYRHPERYLESWFRGIFLIIAIVTYEFNGWIAPNLYVSRPLPRQNKLFIFDILTWYSSTATYRGLKNVFVYTFWWFLQFVQVKDDRKFLFFSYFAQKFQLECSKN